MDGHLLAWMAFWSVEPEDGRVRTELLLEETDLWRRGNLSPDWYLEDQLLRLVQVPEGEERIAVEMPSWSVTVDRDRAYWAAAGLYVGTTEEYLARLTSGMSSAVSEPATGLLLALGLSALAVKRAKR
jgi:hypothetical protein